MIKGMALNPIIINNNKRLKIDNNFYKEIDVIYVVNQVGTKFYKIGKSTNFKIKKRLAQLNTASPLSLEVVQCFYVENSKQAEIYLHSQLALKRLNGEWFDLSEKDLNDIKSNILNEVEI